MNVLLPLRARRSEMAKTVNLMCTCCRFSRVPFFATLRTPACQASLPMGYSTEEYWSGLLCPPAGDLPNPSLNPCLVTSLALQVGSLPLAPPEKDFSTNFWITFFFLNLMLTHGYYISGIDSQKLNYLKNLYILPNFIAEPYFPKGSVQFIDLLSRLQHAFTSINYNF